MGFIEKTFNYSHPELQVDSINVYYLKSTSSVGTHYKLHILGASVFDDNREDTGM